MPIHSLHIGKTGSTACNHVIKPYCEQMDLILHKHGTRLSQLPKGDPVYFFMRHPVARFVSGFNSRQRCGKPRYNSPWDLNEARAFGIFPTARSLAEALSDPNPKMQDEAHNAMRGIIHVNMTFKCWFWDFAEIEKRGDEIIFVGIQEDLNADFERLKRVLGLPAHLALPTDPVDAHVSPAGQDRDLSDLGTENLTRWYADDIELYNQCLGLRAKLNARLDAAVV